MQLLLPAWLLLLLLAAAPAPVPALHIVHPEADESVRADFAYELQWTANASDPAEAYFALLSESGATHGRWRLRTAARAHTFLPSFADFYTPDTRNGARVRLEVVAARPPQPEEPEQPEQPGAGTSTGRRVVLARREFWINGTSWQNNLRPDFNWSSPAAPSSTPRSAEEQARILNGAASGAGARAGHAAGRAAAAAAAWAAGAVVVAVVAGVEAGALAALAL